MRRSTRGVWAGGRRKIESDPIYSEYERSLGYDLNGQLTSTTHLLKPNGETARTFTVNQSWDSEGRPSEIEYPTLRASGALKVKTAYESSTGFAYQQSLVNALGGRLANTELSRINSVDAFGHVLSETAFSGLNTTRSYHSTTGALTGVCVNLLSGCNVNSAGNLQAWDYGQVISGAWDEFGNLMAQKNVLQAYTESFTYDKRFRLVESRRSVEGIAGASQSVQYRYDALGNLVKKSDYAAAITYGTDGKGPHQVSKVYADEAKTQLVTENTYNLAGDLTAGGGRTLWYNYQHQPLSVTKGSASATYVYDGEGSRIFEKEIGNGKTIRTWKIGKLFEYSSVTMGSVTTVEERSYLGGIELSYKPAQNGKAECFQWRVLHSDRLGSIDTVTDPTGAILEQRGFDPFGKPRAGNGQQDNTLDGQLNGIKGLFNRVTTRGYTGHDHADSVGLIHMNGRIYDPDLGRFTGIDPFITNPLNAQTANPYSYVSNNPVMGTDPTGYVEEGTPAPCAGQSANGCDPEPEKPACDEKCQQEEKEKACAVKGQQCRAVDANGNEYVTVGNGTEKQTVSRINSSANGAGAGNRGGGGGSTGILTLSGLAVAGALSGGVDTSALVRAIGASAAQGLTTLVALIYSPALNGGEEQFLEELAAAHAAGQAVAQDQIERTRGIRRAVIGENQKRVLRAALTLGAITIKFPEHLTFSQPLTPQQELSSLAFNRAWIETLMNNNFTIYDVGRDPERVGNGTPISKWYAMELEAIAHRRYPNYVPVRMKGQ